jgi:hypothetical protein
VLVTAFDRQFIPRYAKADAVYSSANTRTSYDLFLRRADHIAVTFVGKKNNVEEIR